MSVSGKDHQRITEFPYHARLTASDSLLISKTGKEPLLYSVYSMKRVMNARQSDAFKVEVTLEKDSLVAREYFKEKTVIFSEKLPVGTYQFTVPLLPRFTGKYTLNPVKVELMYFPVVNANNAGGEIWITERNTKDIRKKGND